MNSFIIKNVNIITMNDDKKIIENGAVIVNDDIIYDIGKEDIIFKYKCKNIIDGKNGILMPGMINAHTHVPMVIFRSLGDDIPDRLKKYIFPMEKHFINKEAVSCGAEYGIAEMLLSGVTTFADMYYFEDEVAKASEKLGIRTVAGETIVNFPSPDSKNCYGGLDYSSEFIKKWKGSKLVVPAVSPHAPYTNDEEHLKKAFDIAEKYDVPIMMHLEEMPYEMEEYKEKYNMTPVQYLDSIGILNERFVGAHLIYADKEDIEIMNKRKIGIVQNIGANAKAGKGVPPLREMQLKKMKIGLGTDGPMSGNTLDIITQMQLTAKIQKLYNRDRSLFPAKDIVEMATIGGARALNIDKYTGSIEKGKKADMVLIETSSVNMQPIYDYYSVLVYSANSSNVDTVIVDGNIVVKDKKLTKCNLKDLQSCFKKLSDFISKKKEEM